MSIARLLLLTDATGPADDLTALTDAARDRGIHVSALVLGRLDQIPPAIYGVGDVVPLGTGVGWDADRADTTEAASRRAGVLAERLGAAGVAFDVAVVVADLPGLQRQVRDRALTADLVVLDGALRGERETFARLLRTALVESPAGVVLNAAAPRALQPATVLLPWSPGLPAGRAVRAALPLLRDASEVVVTVIDPDLGTDPDPGADLAAWLGHHGCRVTVETLPSGGRDVADTIRTRARETGADLVVMGAWDHSRLVQTVFGGTTRTMVDQTDVAVLLAH